MNWIFIVAIVALILYMVYESLKETLIVIVYSLDKTDLDESKKALSEQYPNHTITYKVYKNEEEFMEDYSKLLVLKKKCIGCKFIPLGNVKFLTEKLPLDYWYKVTA